MSFEFVRDTNWSRSVPNHHQTTPLASATTATLPLGSSRVEHYYRKCSTSLHTHRVLRSSCKVQTARSQIHQLDQSAIAPAAHYTRSSFCLLRILLEREIASTQCPYRFATQTELASRHRDSVASPLNTIPTLRQLLSLPRLLRKHGCSESCEMNGSHLAENAGHTVLRTCSTIRRLVGRRDC
jgi:hypothetical protein